MCEQIQLNTDYCGTFIFVLHFDVLSWKWLLSPVVVCLFIKLIIGELGAFDADMYNGEKVEHREIEKGTRMSK